MKKILYVSLLSAGLLTTSCTDKLEIEPTATLTESNAFVTSSNFESYAWGLYNFIGGDVFIGDDSNTHLMVNNTGPSNNVWAYQGVTENTGNSNWDFSYIRRVNTMLDHVDDADMTEADKKHWRAVGLFFRSNQYFKMLSKYGDIPWIEHVVSDGDTDILYGPRTSRDEVAANILRDLKEAEANIRENGNGKNTINRKVVQALISRFALFEGTWRKYHGLSGADTYLNACAEYSKKLIDAVPKITPYYDDLFTSESLDGVDGVLLYFAYGDNLFGMTHQAGRQSGASGRYDEATKAMINLYLCTDGKPIATSPLFAGDKDPYSEFRNRDRRLHLTFLPPYRISVNGNNDKNWKKFQPGETVTFGVNTYTLTEEDCKAFTENIDLLQSISKEGRHRLPHHAWNNSTTNGGSPRFRSYTTGGGSPATGRFGYWFWKYYNEADCLIKHGQNTTDFALFRIGETMLNYAEAMCELGKFDQGVADLTINKLRVRGGVAPMKVSEIDDNFDPNRDKTVPALLWEIRRERHVELIGEDFTFNDIRRWKKCDYLSQPMKGVWVKNGDYNNTLQIEGYADVNASKDKEGYVVYRQTPKAFQDHYYLYPVPIKELVMNSSLTQNPGYNGPSAK